jgi:type IV secretion system protein VirB11
MTPDRLIVGEVRDRAALDMLKAFQCGTAGLATIHAHSPEGALRRLEQCCQEASGHSQRALIGEAIDTVVTLTRTLVAWRLDAVWMLEGYHGKAYTYTPWR